MTPTNETRLLHVPVLFASTGLSSQVSNWFQRVGPQASNAFLMKLILLIRGVPRRSNLFSVVYRFVTKYVRENIIIISE